jgi:hypothetical protein
MSTLTEGMGRALRAAGLLPSFRRPSHDYWAMQAQALPGINHHTMAAHVKRERRRQRNIRNARRMGL